MTVYYDLEATALASACRFKYTAFETVIKKKPEFWLFMLLHVTLVCCAVTGIVDANVIGTVPVESAAIVQFFMTFFLTFYNQHCYARYMALYKHSTTCIDAVLLFVFELSVSFNHPVLEHHRTQATKYVLSAVYIFFLDLTMGLTGGASKSRQWKELVHKGLLSRVEMEVLSTYPGGKVELVLANWALQIIDHALDVDEVYWGKKQQRIAHLHNRINAHMTMLLESIESTGNIIALPIPYPYYHLMNLVLVLNFFLMAFVLALFAMPATIPAFAISLLIFLGLREVATQLADPFGNDEIDFPVVHFLRYAFDQAVCLLEALGRADQKALLESIADQSGFTDDNIRSKCDKDLLYHAAGVTKTNQYDWARATPVNHVLEEEDVIGMARKTLRPRTRAYNEQRAKEAAKLRVEKAALQKKCEDANAEIERLSQLIADATPEPRFSAQDDDAFPLATTETSIDQPQEELVPPGSPAHSPAAVVPVAPGSPLHSPAAVGNHPGNVVVGSHPSSMAFDNVQVQQAQNGRSFDEARIRLRQVLDATGSSGAIRSTTPLSHGEKSREPRHRNDGRGSSPDAPGNYTNARCRIQQARALAAMDDEDEHSI